jgi:hypothetical protein
MRKIPDAVKGQIAMNERILEGKEIGRLVREGFQVSKRCTCTCNFCDTEKKCCQFTRSPDMWAAFNGANLCVMYSPFDGDFRNHDNDTMPARDELAAYFEGLYP